MGPRFLPSHIPPKGARLWLAGAHGAVLDRFDPGQTDRGWTASRPLPRTDRARTAPRRPLRCWKRGSAAPVEEGRWMGCNVCGEVPADRVSGKIRSPSHCVTWTIYSFWAVQEFDIVQESLPKIVGAAFERERERGGGHMTPYVCCPCHVCVLSYFPVPVWALLPTYILMLWSLEVG